MSQIALDIFTKILDSKKTSIENWQGKPLEKAKLVSPTTKGDVGEDFLVEMLIRSGFDNVERLPGQRGDYDVSAQHAGKSFTFEVKSATEDVRKSFQFNGIRLDRRYSHLFCLGISPDNIHYLIVQKSAIGTDDYKIVPMAKDFDGSAKSFKLTRTLGQLKTFDGFEAEVRGL